MAPQTRRVTRSQAKPQESTATPTPKPKAAAPATPPASTTKTKPKPKSASPKGSKPTGVKKQSARPSKKPAKTQTQTPPGTWPEDPMDAPVILRVDRMNRGTVRDAALDRRDLVFEQLEIDGEELERFRELGQLASPIRSEDHEEKKPTWIRPFHLSARNDRLEASTRWNYRHFEAAWKSLSGKIEGLAACFVKELPEGSYKDTVGPDLDRVLSELCHKPADYYDEPEGLGKQWLVEAFLWSKVQWHVLKPQYTETVDDDPWSNFIDTLARLKQYAEKPSLFSQTVQLWSAKSAMVLYALHGKRPSHIAKHAVNEWLTFWWAQFYTIDDPESDSESSEGPWSETTQGMLEQVVEQIRSIEVLRYGIEDQIWLVSQPPGHPFSQPPCKCVNLTGKESGKATRIDMWVQPGVEIFPVRHEKGWINHVPLDRSREEPLHSLAARVATGLPGPVRKRRTPKK